MSPTPRCIAAIAAMCIACAAPAARAQSAPGSPDTPAAAPWLDFTLLDAPFTVDRGFRAPSMQQSLDFSTAGYEGLHAGLARAFGDRKKLGRAAIVIADVATTLEVALPLSSVWVHEEFHRAAMGQRGINSHDDVYDFHIASDAIAVSHVTDADISRLKREHPAEWVRVNAAGIEGELMLVRDLERRRFTGQSHAWHLPLYWITKAGTIGYVASGSWSDADGDVDRMNAQDGADVARRDFTGHDFLGWVYDLHRFDEPYEARGIHPSGIGIDRYRKRAHLTPEESRYLKRQGKLQLLNLVDPALFGVNEGFRLGKGTDPLRLSVGMSHYLTSFGYSIEGVALAGRRDTNLALTIRAYHNGQRAFPGVEAELLDRSVTLAGREWQLSPRLAAWMQPKGQRFDTTEAAAGGLAGLRLRTPLGGRLGAFADVEVKSAGWVAGNPYLERNTSLRVGLSVM